MSGYNPRFLQDIFRGSLLAGAAGLTTLACASSDGPATGSAELAEEAIVVAVLTRAPDDSYNTYLTASAEVPEGTLDLSSALELPDALVAHNGEAIFVGDNERLTLQRYEVNSDYSFTMAGEISLQRYGVEYISNEPLFFSRTSAYYVDAASAQIIAFNPSTMKITAEIQVPEIRRNGYLTWMGPPARWGDGFIATLLYTNEDWTETAPDSTVAIITEDADQPIRTIQDDRGAGSYLSFVGADGHFYIAADGLSGNLALGKLQEVPSSRVLRVKSGTDTFEASFMLDLGELIETPGIFGFWPVAGNSFVVQAWASDVDPDEVLEPGEGGWGKPYFDWMFVDLETASAKPVAGLERSAPYNTLRFELDGKTYVQRLVDGVQRAELYQLGEDASAAKVAETKQGDFWFLGRVSPSNQ